MTKCIGIISWLPNEPELRSKRLETLNATLESCYKVRRIITNFAGWNEVIQ